MLSKMMTPEAAKEYAESVKSNEKISTVLLNGNKVESKKEEEKKKVKNSTKGASSNWQKYKDIVSKPTTQKSPSKRQLPNSGSPQKGKRKAKAKTAPHLIKSMTKNVSINMDLENMELTKQVAMDCEMVGIGDGTESMLARVSIVNRHGACIYDKYVKPQETVRDYRTPVSGIQPHHLQTGEDFQLVQTEVSDIIRGRILVGHALKNDLAVLYLSHPRRYLRDTSRYSLFRKVSKGNTPSLKKLAAELLGVDIQTGEHNSIEDARAAMQLYVLYKNRWEADIHGR